MPPTPNISKQLFLSNFIKLGKELNFKKFKMFRNQTPQKDHPTKKMYQKMLSKQEIN